MRILAVESRRRLVVVPEEHLIGLLTGTASIQFDPETPELRSCRVSGVFHDFSARSLILEIEHPSFTIVSEGTAAPRWIPRFVNRTSETYNQAYNKGLEEGRQQENGRWRAALTELRRQLEEPELK